MTSHAPKPAWLQKTTPGPRAPSWGQAAEAIADDREEAAPISGTRAAVPPTENEEAPAPSLRTITLVSRAETAEAALVEARTLLEAAKADAGMQRAAAEGARQELAELARRTMDEAEEEMVKLALAIAERVIGRELAMSSELVVEWVRDTLAESAFASTAAIAASADVGTHPETWDELAPRVVSDPTLPPATCELRDGSRTIVVSARERLRLVSDHLEIEPIAEVA